MWLKAEITALREVLPKYKTKRATAGSKFLSHYKNTFSVNAWRIQIVQTLYERLKKISLQQILFLPWPEY